MKNKNNTSEIITSLLIILNILLLPFTILAIIFGFSEDLINSYNKHSKK